MSEIIWTILAWLASRGPITEWLIRRAERTPYNHITSADGTDVYMRRFWLFNGYDAITHKTPIRWFPISVRVHHIRRADQDRHLHDHPCNSRTLVMRGWYVDQREGGQIFARTPGDTAALRFGTFHRISDVSIGGVWTVFITGRYRGTWGFKVPYDEYLDARR